MRNNEIIASFVIKDHRISELEGTSGIQPSASRIKLLSLCLTYEVQEIINIIIKYFYFSDTAVLLYLAPEIYINFLDTGVCSKSKRFQIGMYFYYFTNGISPLPSYETWDKFFTAFMTGKSTVPFSTYANYSMCRLNLKI